MKVLVTGHLGYLGKVLIPMLEQKGHQWEGLDWGLNQPGEMNRFQDVRKARVRDVDAIIHLAAIVGEPACMFAPKLARSVNLDGSINMIDQAVKLQIPLIFASTCSVYGAADEILFEHSRTTPQGPYARDRLEAEQYALDNEAVSLRFGTLFGWSPRWRTDLVINKWAQLTATKQPIQVTGGKQWRPFCHVKDAAQAICLLLEKAQDRECFGKIYNCAGVNSTILELANIMYRAVDANVEIQDKIEDMRNYKVSSDRLVNLGWEPNRDLIDMVKDLVGKICDEKPDIDQPWVSNLEALKYRIETNSV